MIAATLLLVAALVNGDALTHASTERRPPESLTGGRLLTYNASKEPSLPLLNTSEGVSTLVSKGRQLFAQDWSLAHEGSAVVRLAGPNFDRASCGACHVEAGVLGGREARTDGAPAYLVVKSADAGGRAVFGDQVNTRHIDGGPAEAAVDIRYLYRKVRYRDGSMKELRHPVATATAADGERYPVNLRSAPVLFGWGLMEQVDAAVLSHFDDPYDANGDGISGRLPLRNAVTGDTKVPGLFGWKSSQATLRGQIAAALRNDMGIETPVDCNRDCIVEMRSADLDALTRYVAQLRVPAQRNQGDMAFQRGEQLFGLSGCSQCHVPVLRTRAHPLAEFSEQSIWPYSDMMLHDMGPGLRDVGDSPDALEWRTAPLWGLGLVESLVPEHGFLHDGRARDLEEAVLWHGGEAQVARHYFLSLKRPDRAALLDYVRSL